MGPGMKATFIRLMEEPSPSARQLPIKDKRHFRTKMDLRPRSDFRKARLRLAPENIRVLAARLRCGGMRTSASAFSTSLGLSRLGGPCFVSEPARGRCSHNCPTQEWD